MVEQGVIVTVALAGLAGLVWLIRLEGRINTHEKGCEERQKKYDERHEDMKELMADMHKDIKRLVHGEVGR